MTRDIPERNEVAVDSRGRISLTWRVHKEHRLYVAEESSLSGIIILTPGALVPAMVRIPEEEPPPLAIEELRKQLDLLRGRKWS